MKHSPLRRLAAALLLAALTALTGSLRSEASPHPLVPRVPRAAPKAVTATVLHYFNSNTASYSPSRGLTLGPDGSLYGVTVGNSGAVFQITPDGTFHSLHEFSSSNEQDGLSPAAKLLLVGSQLFGTCGRGGINLGGTVFVIDLSKVSPTDNAAGFSVIHYFDNTNSSDGDGPSTSLSLASDGNLYGTTGYGGGNLSGIIFQLKPDNGGHFSVTPRTTPSGRDTFNGSFADIHDFDQTGGLLPLAGVVQGPDGFLYGTTRQRSNPYSAGTVYKVGTDGSGFTLLHAFLGTDGDYPESLPLFASDGSLYATARYGGQGGNGTVFQIQPGVNGVFSANAPFQVIHDFTDYFAGSNPVNELIQASDGNLYGGTYYGGTSSDSFGSLFRITASGGQFSTASPFSTIYSFDGPSSADNTGGGVSGPLLQGQDGRLYGETEAGGDSTHGGTVFVLDAGLPAPPAVSGIVGSIAPPDTTTADTTLIVHGSSFNGGDKVAIDGQNVPVTSRDYSKAADEQITVTLSAPLRAGAHTVVIADTAPGIRVSSPVAFSVTLLSPRITQITRGGGGSVTTTDTTLVIHGDSFVPSDAISLGSLGGTTISQTSLDSSGSQFTVTLSKPLAAGHYAVTVTHAAPNGLVSNTYDLLVVTDAPVISAVSGDSNPPVVTTNDTTLIIHGTGFAGADAVVISGTTVSVTVAKRDLTTNPADEQITVTLSQPLALGSYSAAVVHAAPDGRKSALFPFTVAGAAAPKITSTAYSVQNGQGVLNISGTGFVRGGTTAFTPNDPNVTLGGKLTITFVSSTQLTATFSQPPPAGVYTLTETNPDKKTAQIPVYVLAVTGATYDPSSPSVTLSGAGFSPGAAITIGDASDGSVILPLQITGANKIVVSLLNPLPSGPHTFTVTNPDGQTAKASLTVLSSPVITSLVYHVTSSGSTLTINGSGFVETPSVSLERVTQGTVLTLKTPISPTQLVVTLSQPLPAGSQQVTVTNPDNQKATGTLTVGSAPSITDGGLTAVTGPSGSTLLVVTGRNLAGAAVDGVALNPASTATVANNSGALITQLVFHLPSRFGNGSHTVDAQNADGLGTSATFAPRLGGRAARPASSPASNTVSVFTSGHTSYKVASDSGGGVFGWFLGLFGIHLHSNGGTPTQVIASNSSALGQLPVALITTLGNGTVTGVISNDGGSLISQYGGGLISQDGGGIVSHDSGGIVSHLISQDGGGLLTKAQMVTADDAKVADSLVAFAKPAASAGIRARLASGSGGATLEIAKSDQAGVGSSDMTLTSLDSSGSSVDVLRMRFTAGERDLVLYEAPGFHLTPTNGTPAPVAATPAGLTVTRGPVTRDSHTHQPFQVLILTNTGKSTQTGPFLIGLTGLPAGVTVAGPSTTIAGSPAVAMPSSALIPGASVQVRVDFADPTNVRFSYGTAIYAGL